MRSNLSVPLIAVFCGVFVLAQPPDFGGRGGFRGGGPGGGPGGMGQRTALLENYFLEKALCTFVVAGAKHQVICREVPVARLSANVHSVRRMLASANPDTELDALLKELGDVLIGPALAGLPADIRNLVIVPADVLNYIPFQVLPLASGGALIDRFTVSYLPGASDYKRFSVFRVFPLE